MSERDDDPDSTLPMGLDARSLLGRPRLTLRVVEGPQAGQEWKGDGELLTIGSSSANRFVLADSTVSRRHAEIATTPAGVLVRDLASRNGTFLDGNRVKEAFLYPGARLRFGGTTVLVQVADQPVESSKVDRFGGLVGQSPAMQQLFAVLARVAPTDATVVLWGETGTGKEVAARALHDASSRAKGPFAVLDGSAVDRELVSAELFGHEVGAFTGAASARAGAFEQAHGGTLFLDEVGELPLELQAKLLRALEAREVKRLGGAKPVRFDCRVIAATHRNLKAMVRDGTFREDLYYRLAQVTVKLPPLRERREDIPLLVERFLGTARASWDALRALGALELRGNVRELKNVVERARALAGGGEITAAHVECDQAAAPAASLEDAERAVIEDTLRACGYLREKAAEKLGISLPTLRERIRRYGIAVPKRAK